ncbi:MAG TPA: gfo/Idh/MocA family oxidoreductase, partial [Pirellulales bacterium]|nr:gfo/Idh/MocA family oxidoreductase [Pirellulales bacterium]
YSGGKMTDWGAHHVDIATWAIGADSSGPISVEGQAKHPNTPNGYNTATEFLVTCKYKDGTDLVIRHDTENGITFEGDKGRFFVSRGSIKGTPVDELKDHPLPEGAIEKLYGGKPTGHMANFFQCVKSRKQPISDVFTHHRSITTCHLANIAIRLGRKLNWDPVAEQIVGDSEAQSWQSRAQRKGYEIVA